ncbi:MAG: flagellar basal body rod protein FlgC [Thermodesulfobacteria bacterium]|nr:flagellar basal body rod protein FlgC [Thermodesulfobacteriota bacterium]
MSLMDVYKIAGSGLYAQRVRISVAATNIANADVTRTLQGGPYVAKDVVLRAVPISDKNPYLQGVEVEAIVNSKRPFKMVYDPDNPDADKNGYVKYPNVDVVTEMVELLSASRAYEANLAVVTTSKDMALRTIDLLRT